MTTTTTTEHFWRDLDDAIVRSKAMPVDCWGRSHGDRMMHDFLHSHRDMWQKIKPDAMRNADRLAMLTAALLVRNSKWDASRTLTDRNPLRGMPIRFDECRTDAEREAWQRGYELGCGDEWSDADTTTELTQLPEPQKRQDVGKRPTKTAVAVPQMRHALALRPPANDERPQCQSVAHLGHLAHHRPCFCWLFYRVVAHLGQYQDVDRFDRSGSRHQQRHCRRRQ